MNEQNEAPEAPHPALPMKWTGARRIENELREYRERRNRHLATNPEYYTDFPRPSETTAEKVWALLADRLAGLASHLRPALVVALDAAIMAGEEKRLLTHNLVFDALCARWSENYVEAIRKGPQRTSWDMPAQLKDCWRDLLRNGIQMSLLMPLVQDGLGLYTTERNPLSGYTVVFPDDPDDGVHPATRLREEFIKIVSDDVTTGGRYRRRSAKPRLLVAGSREDGMDFQRDETEFDTDSYKVVASWAYNVAHPGPASRKVIEHLQSTTLFFDTDEFRAEYARLEERRDEINVGLWDDFKFDVTQSNAPLKGKDGKPSKDTDGEPLTVRKFKMFRAMKGRSKADCTRIKALTEEWDSLNGQLNSMQNVRRQLDETDAHGEIEIRSRFLKVTNRRYQALDFWPSEVSSKSKTEQEEKPATQYFLDEEGREQSYTQPRRTTTRRARLFRIAASRSVDEREKLKRHAEYGAASLPEGILSDRQNLAGVDVSGSWITIQSVFLGLRGLEESLRTMPYKELVAIRAVERHVDPGDSFKLRGEPTDKQLQDAVKVASMTSGYGSPPWQIAKTLGKSPEEFGPGLGSAKNIERLLTDDKLELGVIERVYKPMCSLIARHACRTDPYAGVSITDPYDGETIRWNPIRSKAEAIIDDGPVKIFAKIPLRERTVLVPWAKDGKSGRYPKAAWEPAEPNEAGDYPVWEHKLSQMLPPCLVHTADSMFAGFVIEELESRGVTNFVSIHDSWIVPEDAYPKLLEAVKAAAEPWMMRLGDFYLELMKLLPTDRPRRRRADSDELYGPDYTEWLQKLHGIWADRVARSHWPKFRVGEVQLVVDYVD